MKKTEIEMRDSQLGSIFSSCCQHTIKNSVVSAIKNFPVNLNKFDETIQLKFQCETKKCRLPLQNEKKTKKKTIQTNKSDLIY